MELTKRGFSKKFERYEFAKRGSLFSPYVTIASDIDLHFFGKEPIEQKLWDFILNYPDNFRILKIEQVRRYCSKRGIDDEIPFDSDEMSSFWEKSPYEAVILSGVYKTKDEFLVNIDVSTSCAEEQKEPMESRIIKLKKYKEQGDYAKIIQRSRALLGMDGGNKKLRNEMMQVTEEHTSKLRFLSKQFLMLNNFDVKFRQNYCKNTLGVDYTESFVKDVEEELQLKSIAIVYRYKQQLMDSLCYLDLELLEVYNIEKPEAK